MYKVTPFPAAVLKTLVAAFIPGTNPAKPPPILPAVPIQFVPNCLSAKSPALPPSQEPVAPVAVPAPRRKPPPNKP